VRDAVSDYPCLTASGAGGDEEGAFTMCDGVALRFGEVGKYFVD